MADPLDRTFDVTRVRGEVVAWAGVLLAAIGLRLAGLQDHALSPDGARRAFAAYALYTGQGADLGNAAGGPFGALFGALLYFLFGVSDGIARLGPVLAGVGLVVATIWLRPYLGRSGALLAGALLALSPSSAYFSRQVQPDIYAQFFALVLFIAVLRMLDHGQGSRRG
ncbi:MAG TPA: glycosyltransferase family 39 protein, partial [Vicinamibacteria bacterium]